MFKDIFKKFDYYWFFFFLTISACFLYFLTNPVMGIDDEQIEFFVKHSEILQVNRIGKLILKALFGYEFVPFAYDILCIGSHISAVITAVYIFRQYLTDFSKQQALIFSVSAVSFPFIAFHLIFMESCIDVGFAYLSGVFASYFFLKYFYEQRKKVYFLYTLALLIFSASLYETGLFYFVIVSLFVILYSFLYGSNKKQNIKSASAEIASIVLLCVSSLLLYKIILLIVQMFYKYYYNRVNEYKYYDFSSFSAFSNSLITSINNFVKIYLSDLPNNFGCKIILFSCSVLILISLYYSVKRKNLIILLLSVLMILTPLTYFILTGFYNMPYRVFLSYGYISGMTFAVLYRLFQKNQLLCRLFIFICFIVVFHQVKEINNIFYTENLKAENDKLTAYSIDYDLKKLNLDGKPVVFVGIKKDISLPHKYYSMADEINISTFNWDRFDSVYGELFVKRSYRFMRKLGYEIGGYFENQINDDASAEFYIDRLYKIVPGMNIYPKENSIKDEGDFVVIKLGKSRFDSGISDR